MRSELVGASYIDPRKVAERVGAETDLRPGLYMTFAMVVEEGDDEVDSAGLPVGHIAEIVTLLSETVELGECEDCSQEREARSASIDPEIRARALGST